MKHAVLLFMILAFTAASRAGGQGESKPAQQTATPKTAPQFDLDQYQFALLKKGPKWTAEKSPELDKLQAGHMANIQRMAKLNKLMAAGPMGNDGDIRGIFVFKAASLDEAKALAAEDPAIKAGRLVIEFFIWHAPKGIGVSLNEFYRKDPDTKMTMALNYLVLLKKSAQATAQATQELQQLQLEHLWSIRRRLDARQYVAAGPLSGSSELAGLLVVAAPSLAAAKALAETDPMVKAGRLMVEIHPWYVAQEVWP